MPSNLIRILSSTQPIGNMTFMFVLDLNRPKVAAGLPIVQAWPSIAWPNPAGFWNKGAFTNYVEKTEM